MRKWYTILNVLVTMLVLIVAVSASGCGKAAEEKGTSEDPGIESTDDMYYSFQDDNGVEITLEVKPERVAVLFSSFAEVWKLSGGTVAITVGESVERGFAEESAVLVDAGAGKTINQELLVEAQPDFVICSADIEAQAETAEMLNRAGIPAACFHVEIFEDYLHMLKICTDITGDGQAYEENGTAVQERIEALFDSLEGEPEKKNILFIRAGSGASSTKAKTAEEHFAAAMLKEIGTYNIAENAPVLLDGLSVEEVLYADPDYIFISTMGKESAAKEYMESVLQEPAWQSLTAVQNGDYVYLPKDLFQFKPNGRWDEAYEYLIGLVYGTQE